MVAFTGRTLAAHWHLDRKMASVDRAYNKVRSELSEVGLLYDPIDDSEDGYLDQIRVEVANLPSMGEAGYVYEDTTFIHRLVGYEAGVIYLPADLPLTAYVPGGTLTDVIRHEYAHAWHWLEPEFFETGWFNDIFGSSYDDTDSTPFGLWTDRVSSSRVCTKRLQSCRNDHERDAFLRRNFKNDFVSEYASTLFCEDFAETFMYFLRYRNSLEKFKSRTGVYRKLKGVERCVRNARRELGL